MSGEFYSQRALQLPKRRSEQHPNEPAANQTDEQGEQGNNQNSRKSHRPKLRPGQKDPKRSIHFRH